MKKQYAFHFDSASCSGCKTCQVACKDKNNLEVGVLWRRVYEIQGGRWEKKGNAWFQNIKAYNVSLSCNHCEDPVCLKGCPTQAISKRNDGVVVIDASRCMGCKYCQWSCPYGAPQYDESRGIMTKCDFCIDYIDDGKEPACVSSCPMRALSFGEKKEIGKSITASGDIYPLPDSSVTSPAIFINPHKNSYPSGSKEASIRNAEEI